MNPDVEELRRYNQEAARRECRHVRGPNGSIGWCPKCGGLLTPAEEPCILREEWAAQSTGNDDREAK